jgi:hypothetical protein
MRPTDERCIFAVCSATSTRLARHASNASPSVGSFGAGSCGRCRPRQAGGRHQRGARGEAAAEAREEVAGESRREVVTEYRVEFNVYGAGGRRHVFYGPAERVEQADTTQQAIKQALVFACDRFPDRRFEVVAVDALRSPVPKPEGDGPPGP